MSERKKRKASAEGESGLDLAVQYFVTSGDKKTRANVNFSLSMDTLLHGAADEGLSPNQITLILDVAASGKYPDAVSSKLLRCLIPASTVPVEAAAKAVSWMCTNKPSTAIQTLMIRWLVLIYKEEGVLEEKDKFRGLYSMIFYFLQNETMCPHVCHLLYLMTKKEDVRLFRVQPLLQLQKKMGTQPYILGLLSLYKLFRPDLVALVIPRTCKVFFRAVDKSWAIQIRKLQDARKRQGIEPADQTDLSAIDTTLATKVKQASKKRRQELIPKVSTAIPVQGSEDTDLATPAALRSVPFSQIRSFDDLLQNLDRLELPSQMAAVLKDANLQHVLLCYPDPSIAARLAYWLDHVLYEEFFGPHKDQSRCEELLITLVKFSDVLQEGVPVCEDFLARYIHIWNGVDHRPYVLKMITRFRLHSFHALNDRVLEPLRKLFFSSSVYIKCEIMLCLTELLRNYAAVELPRYKYTLQLQRNVDNVAHSSTDFPNCLSVFREDVEEFAPMETIIELCSYVDQMASVGLVAEDHAVLMHCVLMFHDVVASLYPQYQIPFTTLPSHCVVYRCLFSSNAMALARMCHLICRYGETFKSLRGLDTSPLSSDEETALRETISLSGRTHRPNDFILDFCDTLWRTRAFKSKEANSVYKKLKEKDMEMVQASDVSGSLSLSQHQALVGFAINFLASQIRNIYVQYLDTAGVFGIPEFISMFIPAAAAAAGSK